MKDEIKKIVTADEIKSGVLTWLESEDEKMKLFFSSKISELKVFGDFVSEWNISFENRTLKLGETLKKAKPETELSIFVDEEINEHVVSIEMSDSTDDIIIRKRLSLNEFNQRKLKWFAREDELYGKLFPSEDFFSIEIDGKVTPNRRPDYDRRTLALGEAIKAFSPGDTLLIHRSRRAGAPVLVIGREKSSANVGADAMTSLRLMVARLISRPLSEFNEGEIKGLVALLDENKSLWQQVHVLHEENEKLKERVSTLEDVFEQFSKNSFFQSKKDFIEWVLEHINLIEKGLRVLYCDYPVTLEDGRKRRLDVLCQDKKGVLVAVEVVFNPTQECLENIRKSITWHRENIQALTSVLSEGKFQANSARGIVVSNHEKSELVNFCLQNAIKLCVVNGGFIVDVVE
ncbi:MAG: hypothetical protein HQM10_17995 [Candidatus Riflebacteria bacterium]|nr:hypothetical protein [Candidatus Riflebacteria bacterium]